LFVKRAINALKKKIAFIINPISGGKSKVQLPELIEQHLDRAQFSYQLCHTEFVGHAKKLVRDLLPDTDLFVAVGGDGTVNEIASVLVGSDKYLGIIPMGSGNGLATFLGIPFQVKEALELINQFNFTRIDSATLNGHPIFNVSGIGFDAQISTRFARDKTRGLWGYIRNTFAEVLKYRPQWYILKLDGKTIQRKAFMISLANSSQYGNNAHISPNASLTDGLLDICVVKPFPLYMFPVLSYRMFSKTADRSAYLEIFKIKEALIQRDVPGPVHLDGEPIELEAELHIVVNPASLNVIN
jgi:YegS/Rv2252/BmrU family lipid kinase